MKHCPACGENKPLDQFGISRKRYDGLQGNCKSCRNAYLREWYQQNKALHRARVNANPSNVNKSFAKYGMTRKDRDDMLVKQLNKCMICKQEITKPHIDHDHVTGKVRGILCMACNVGLGHFKDDVLVLQNAIEYLNDAG